MVKESIKHGPFYYGAMIIWRGVLAGVIVWLIVRFIIKILANPTHHLKEIYFALSVVFTIVLSILAFLLIFFATKDCGNMYKSLKFWLDKSPSISETEEELQRTVSERV